jgi:mannose-1-phosphate guanylyltransferase
MCLTTVERIRVITSEDYVALVASDVPELEPGRVFGEPQPMGTAAAAGLGSLMVGVDRPQALIAMLPADHWIGPLASGTPTGHAELGRFADAIHEAALAAQEGHLVTLGIKPTRAATGYGYIRCGPCIQDRTFRVEAFVEKPDAKAATDLVAAGCYWNSGMFVWRADVLLGELRRLQPGLAAQLDQAHHALRAGDRETFRRVWSSIQVRTSIDYAVMERSERLAMVAADFTWSDVGSWEALYYPADEHDNRVVGTHVGIDTRSSLILGHTGRLVATIGVEDMIVVDTPHALLICPRQRAQDVRRLVSKLAEAGLDKYL